MKTKKVLFLILAFLAVFLIGCWDSIEINERLFITAIGLDLNTDPSIEGRYIVTYVYPNIGHLGKNPSQKEAKIVKTTIVETPFDGSRQMTTRVQHPFFFKHLKVFVIGEELFKQPELMKEFLDGVARDSRMNRKIGIIVAEGKAKDILSTKVEETAIIGGYLNSMLNNDSLAARFTDQTFSGIMKDFQFSNASIAPRAVPKKDEYKLSGAAVLKDYRLVGWIGEKENRAIAIAKGKLKSEIIDIKYNDAIISYVITDHISKEKVRTEKGNIIVDFNISLEGYIQQYKLGKGKDIFNTEFISEVEKVIEKTIKKEIEGVVEILQKRYKADVLGIGEHISKYEPKLWEETKSNWEEIYPDVDINVNVSAKIRRTGLTK